MNKKDFNIDQQSSPSWETRSLVAVDMYLCSEEYQISQKTKSFIQVGDFGCGNERVKSLLAKKLKSSFKYRGYDIFPQQDTTKKFDFNNGLPFRQFNLVFCLGLLEYIDNIDIFFKRLSQNCDQAIISYVVKDSKKYNSQRVQSRGWRHHHSIEEIQSILKAHSFQVEDFQLILNGTTGMWLISSQHKNNLSFIKKLLLRFN